MDLRQLLLENMGVALTVIALLGLSVGSFLNVVIYRYPKILAQQWEKDCLEFLKQPPIKKSEKFNLVTPRSRCTNCKNTLKPWHNIPLFSYIFLRGQCAYCKKSISFIYPFIELLAAFTAVIVIYHFGITWQGIFALIFSWNLIVLSMIDIDHQILPDNITLSLLWIGLLGNAFSLFTTPTLAILGTVIGYIFLWSIAKLFLLIRKKDGMGYGDFKMLAMFGAWLGVAPLLNVLLTSVILALVVSLILIIFKKISPKKTIPFGPYLAIGGWLTFVFGPTLANIIERLVT